MDSSSSSSLPELPSEIILEEILTRTSAKTVAKARTLCKQWNEHTHESSFAAKSTRNSDMVSGFFFQTRNHEYEFRANFISASDSKSPPKQSLPDLSFIPERKFYEDRVQIIAAAKQGLLLLMRDTPRPEFIVCKPTTKQWRMIPRPKTRFFATKVAMTVVAASNPKDFRFKIARFSRPKNFVLECKEGSYGCLNLEIFDSRNWSWRLHPSFVLFPASEFLDFHNPMVSVSGFAYVLTTEHRLFALDWAAETWTFLDLPETLGNLSTSQLVDYQGKLGILYLAADSKEFMEIWVMEPSKRDKVSEWNMKKRVSLRPDQDSGRSYFKPLAMACSDMALMKHNFHLCFYNFKDCKKIVTFRDLYVYPDDCPSGYFKIESDEEFVDFASSKIIKKINVIRPISNKAKRKALKFIFGSIVNYYLLSVFFSLST